MSKIEELMKPRYKVIADWPGVAGKIKAGDIIVSDGASNGYWVAGEPYQEDKLKDYPHLFQPLQWWQDREKSEMPEYVKYDKIIYRLTWINHWGEWHPEYSAGVNYEVSAKWHFSKKDFLPATETEYIEYLKQKP